MGGWVNGFETVHQEVVEKKMVCRRGRKKKAAAAAAAKQIWHMYLQLYRSLQRLQSKGLLVLICKSKLFGMSVPPEQRIHFKELRKFVLVQHGV